MASPPFTGQRLMAGSRSGTSLRAVLKQSLIYSRAQAVRAASVDAVAGLEHQRIDAAVDDVTRLSVVPLARIVRNDDRRRGFPLATHPLDISLGRSFDGQH